MQTEVLWEDVGYKYFINICTLEKSLKFLKVQQIYQFFMKSYELVKMSNFYGFNYDCESKVNFRQILNKCLV